MVMSQACVVDLMALVDESLVDDHDDLREPEGSRGAPPIVKRTKHSITGPDTASGFLEWL